MQKIKKNVQKMIQEMRRKKTGGEENMDEKLITNDIRKIIIKKWKKKHKRVGAIEIQALFIK